MTTVLKPVWGRSVHTTRQLKSGAFLEFRAKARHDVTCGLTGFRGLCVGKRSQTISAMREEMQVAWMGTVALGARLCTVGCR